MSTVTHAQSNSDKAQQSVSQSVEFLQTLQDAVAVEEKNVAELQERLNQLKVDEKAIHTEMNAYKIQNSIHSNLLVLPSAHLKDLEKAAGDNRLVINSVNERLKDFQNRRDNIQAQRQRAEEQIRLGESQKKEIQSGSWTKDEQQAVKKALGSLIKGVTLKQASLVTLFQKQCLIIKELINLSLSTAQLSQLMEKEIKSREKQELLGRKMVSLKAFSGPAIRSELIALKAGIGRFADGRFWADEGLRVKETGTMPLLTFGILALLGLIVIIRFRTLCRRYEQRPSVTRHRWRMLCLILVRRSAVFLGIAGVLYGYDLIQFPHFKLPVIRLLLNLILVWIFSRWVLDFLRFWEPCESHAVMEVAKSKLRSLVHIVRVCAVVYILVAWSVNTGGLLLLIMRLLLEIGLIAWCLRFWKRFGPADPSTIPVRAKPPSFPRFLALCLSYLITVGGLMVEVAGYPTLTVYWYISWGKTMVVSLWIVLLFNLIREWQQEVRADSQMEANQALGIGSHPMRWLIIQTAWLFWVICLLDGLVLAWSTNWEVFRTVYGLVNRPWTIGQIHLSFAGLIYAVIILFLTHAMTRIGRFVLTEKILQESAMESGLKVSITSIAIYLMWALGIVFALGVLGVNTTSLAVIFGALSIGIGFGLQNIFNNFISGLILLFERPIQVGDAVEIGGIWGEIKKINVRATVVQTYDNASLIIPNSEFISNQVMNWSFKDQSLRRKINIGVAYGSDIELVRKTLLEIVGRTPNVLRTPSPDVHFLDHGDSSLIFTLRYWTTVDEYYSTSTDIRFELDRLFRERGIEIAFPQRDIHIRSAVEGAEKE